MNVVKTGISFSVEAPQSVFQSLHFVWQLNAKLVNTELKTLYEFWSIIKRMNAMTNLLRKIKIVCYLDKITSQKLCNIWGSLSVKINRISVKCCFWSLHQPSRTNYSLVWIDF
jgi:hypothetical protein